MSEENIRKANEAVEELENAETQELEDKPLEGVAGGADAAIGNTGCIDVLCNLDRPVDAS